MIPDTNSGLNTMTCVSAMQKAIRRGMEKEAMEFAVELMHTSKAFHSMVCNRLEVICYEDIDTIAAPHVSPFVARIARSVTRALHEVDRWSPADGGQCDPHDARAPKSRAGCHVAAAIGLRSLLEDFAPTIPDWAHDQHTLTGRKLGRGLDYFRREGAKPVPPPIGDDPYEDEAYRLWLIKAQDR